MNKQLVNMAYSNYYRKELFTLEEAIAFLWKDNVINVGELAERAIVRNSKNLKQNSRGLKGSDFSDKSDSKYVTVSYYKNSAYASINRIQHKIGMLRVMIHEPKNNKNYFFRIPYKVYAPYRTENNSLKVYFDTKGNPRRPTRKNIRYDLWNYKCSAEEWAQ
jgi:hypothetical protein